MLPRQVGAPAVFNQRTGNMGAVSVQVLLHQKTPARSTVEHYFPARGQEALALKVPPDRFNVLQLLSRAVQVHRERIVHRTVGVEDLRKQGRAHPAVSDQHVRQPAEAFLEVVEVLGFPQHPHQLLLVIAEPEYHAIPRLVVGAQVVKGGEGPPGRVAVIDGQLQVVVVLVRRHIRVVAAPRPAAWSGRP